MKTRINSIGLLACLTLLCSTALAQENYTQWTKYNLITVNTMGSGGGAGVTGDVTNFPVLVRLTSANAGVFSQAKANGADVRFTDSTGTVRLQHQTERWDSAGQAAELWVRIPVVKGNTNTLFRMYWGKAGAADSSKGAGVFDTATGYQAVLHLGEAAGATANDATINAFNGTPIVMGASTNPSDTVGVIGKAKSFHGGQNAIGSYYTLAGTANSKLNFPEDGNYTLSVWADAYNSTFSTAMISKDNRDYNLAKRSTGSKWEMKEYHASGTAGAQYIDYSGTVTPNIWTHVVGVRSGTSMFLYVNGVLNSSTIANDASYTGARSLTNDVRIGGDPNSEAMANNLLFLGAIDEAEISNVSRDSNWVKLSYQTQKIGATAVMLGTEQVPVAATAPAAPTGVTAVAGNAQAFISWTAPSNGGSAITGYTATSNPGSKTCTSTTNTSCTVTGLTNGSSYTFTVTATNLVGTSSPSSPSSSLTLGGVDPVPSPPTNVVATSGNARATVSWSAATANGTPVTGYIVTSNPGAKTCTTTGTLTCIDSTLTNGTSYTFTVVATSAAGNSAPSSASAAVIPATIPDAPTITGVVGASGQVTVTWTAPSSTGGSAISSYIATATQDTSKHCTLAVLSGTLSCAVTGLTNTTAYTFTVVAVNAVGKSVASAPSASVTGILFLGKDPGFYRMGSSMRWRLPLLTGSARIVAMNLSGKVLWSQGIAAGSSEVSWNTGSSVAPAGIYIVRLTTASSRNPKVLAESKIVLTP